MSESKRKLALRNLAYSAALAGKPMLARHADDPVYVESYRRGEQARKRVSRA